MKSSHLCCKKVQKTLLHNRRFYCTAEGFAAQQKVLLHSRKLYIRKVSPMAKTGEKFLLRQKQRISPLYSVFLWTLDSTFVHKLAAAEWYFGAHSAKRQIQLLSQKKPRLSVVQQHHDACLRYKIRKENPQHFWRLHCGVGIKMGKMRYFSFANMFPSPYQSET